MVDEIIQGDNGTVMQTNIRDSNGIVNISGCNVVFTVQSPVRKFEKTGNIVDEENGIAEFTLNSEDVQESGNYVFQAQVTFQTGNKFSSNIHKFKVGRKL